MSDNFEFNPYEGTETNEEYEIKSPSLFKVFLINDDYTTMEFVIHILEKVFRKNSVEAAQIMLNVHKNGKGLAGTYTRDIAETKTMTVIEISQEKGFPLQCTMEKE